MRKRRLRKMRNDIHREFCPLNQPIGIPFKEEILVDNEYVSQRISWPEKIICSHLTAQFSIPRGSNIYRIRQNG
jgi:hypothetical protein